MRIRYDRGTLVLEPEACDGDPAEIPGATWDSEARAWRAPADSHRALIVRMLDTGVRVADEIAFPDLPGGWQLPALRWYQDAAVSAWRAAKCRGTIVLPTGAGKTLVALAAMARVGIATLIVVPTRVLLDQWATSLAAAWPHPIGRLGDGDHEIESITVATYASAISWAPRLGDRFGLVVVDEAHHVGAWCPAELLEMLVAPARLGLTATPPDSTALAQHVGPVVYALGVGDLVGDGLAAHDLITISIELDPEEDRRYREHRGRFAASYAQFLRRNPGASWNGYTRHAAKSLAGREAMAAWRVSREIIAYSSGKRAALVELLARHTGERTLVFTADNATAYAIARDLLIPPITCEIGRAERADVLAQFRAGTVSVLVSAQVLDEGLDVPDADVAIIVGGTSSARRHIQRVGRVLRPREGKRAQIYELVAFATKEGEYVDRRRAGFARPTSGPPPRQLAVEPAFTEDAEFADFVEHAQGGAP